MRQPDGRQQTLLESSINNGHHGKSNGAYQKIFPPIGVQDFQEFPTRRANNGRPNRPPRARFDPPSPMPNRLPPSTLPSELHRFSSAVIPIEKIMN